MLRKSVFMLDSVFIKLLAEKDDAAYKELFARYYDSLKGLAFTYVKDSATAEDLVQDLFLALYYGGQKFDSVMGLKYYLFRSLKNGILNYLKKEGLRRRYEQQMMQGSEPMEDYWEKAMEEEVFVRLNDAVDRLPEQCRKVMKFTLEGKEAPEIARLLDISVTTVKDHRRAGREKLAEWLREGSKNDFLVLFVLC